MENIIVTGASGFIGQRCIEQLCLSGNIVHALYKNNADINSKKKSKNLLWHQVDLLNPLETKSLISKIQAQRLIHFAWYTEPGKFWNSPNNLDWLASSLILLRSFIEAGGQHFLGAGTGAEYDWSNRTNSISNLMIEDLTPLKPSTLYGSCKVAFQQVAKQFCLDNKIDFAWARIFWLYGPGEDKSRLVAYIIKNLLENKEAHLSSGLQQRDFLHVDDVALAFCKLSNQKAQGCFNVGSGEAISIRDFAQLIAKHLNKEYLLKFENKAADNEPPQVCACINKLSSEIGKVQNIDIVKGLESYIDLMKKNNS